MLANHVSARRLFIVWSWILVLPLSAAADFDSGSDGSDGPFAPADAETVVDLSLAADAPWDTPSPVPGDGVYDADKWVVVFKYTTIGIDAGKTVRFLNHPSGAPVVWLATGDVTIAGEVNVNGDDGASNSEPSAYATPGPGGFHGGARSIGTPIPASYGFGPGGGSTNANYANSTRAYGNPRIIPLIGGSGGAGITVGAGAGGGAILIASSTQISLPASGSVRALGGDSSRDGSGGGIRLIAPSITGDGQLRATGGNSGFTTDGRIRVDGDEIDLSDIGDPGWTTEFTTFPVFPADNEPILRVIQIEDEAIPADPGGGVPSTEATIDTGIPVVVLIEAENIPAGTTVEVRIIPARGTAFSETSTPLIVGKGGILTATATVTFPTGKSEIHLQANWTP